MVTIGFIYALIDLFVIFVHVVFHYSFYILILILVLVLVRTTCQSVPILGDSVRYGTV